MGAVGAAAAGAGEGRSGAGRTVAAAFAAPVVAAVAGLPFLSFRANRLVPGDGVFLWDTSSPAGSLVGAAALVLLAVAAVAVERQTARALIAGAGIAAAAVLAGAGASELLADAPAVARVSLGGGFWVVVAFFGLAAADALTRLGPHPLGSVALALAVSAAIALGLGSGWFDDLSILQEYQANADAFAAALSGHLLLVCGSLLPALAIGLPLGRLCFISAGARTVAIPVLNILQTTPSIAMFGLLMVPLGALAAAAPWLGRFGIAGIGAAPAIVALTLYSLLPIVSNTIAGFGAVPAHVREAGRGMGMTDRALLLQAELPLAAPVILTGIRIVVVQNIGLATVAALIGGGGFGTLVFRGMGQAATDLILLGTLPIIALAILATVLLDAAIELSGRRRR